MLDPAAAAEVLDVTDRARDRTGRIVLEAHRQGEEEEQLRAMLVTRRFTETTVDIDIRMLDFEMLQKVYLSE